MATLLAKEEGGVEKLLKANAHITLIPIFFYIHLLFDFYFELIHCLFIGKLFCVDPRGENYTNGKYLHIWLCIEINHY